MGKERRERPLAKALLILLILPFLALSLGGCATSERTYQGAAVGGAAGAGIGALLDHHNPWRGAAIGAAIGSVVGGTMTEISARAARDAASENAPVVYRSEDGRTVVESTPMPRENASTHCHKVRTRVWKDGRLVEDNVKEVCESDKVVRSYDSY